MNIAQIDSSAEHPHHSIPVLTTLHYVLSKMKDGETMTAKKLHLVTGITVTGWGALANDVEKVTQEEIYNVARNWRQATDLDAGRCVTAVPVGQNQLYLQVDTKSTSGGSVVHFGHESCDDMGEFLGIMTNEDVLVVMYENGITVLRMLQGGFRKVCAAISKDTHRMEMLYNMIVTDGGVVIYYYASGERMLILIPNEDIAATGVVHEMPDTAVMH